MAPAIEIEDDWQGRGGPDIKSCVIGLHSTPHAHCALRLSFPTFFYFWDKRCVWLNHRRVLRAKLRGPSLQSQVNLSPSSCSHLRIICPYISCFELCQKTDTVITRRLGTKELLGREILVEIGLFQAKSSTTVNHAIEEIPLSEIEIWKLAVLGLTVIGTLIDGRSS